MESQATSSTSKESVSSGELLYQAAKSGKVDVLKSLLEEGASVHYVHVKTGRNRERKIGTPICTAVGHGHLEVVKLLVEKDEKVLEFKKSSMLGILHMACHIKGSPEVVKYLLGFKCVDIESATTMGFRPIHFCSSSGRLDIMKVLVEHGADLTSLTTQKQSALYLSLTTHNIEMIKYLYDKGLDPNSRDYTGTPGIHRAIKFGYFTVVRTLVEYCKCDIHILDRFNCSVLEEADRSRMSDFSVYLWKAGAETSRALRKSSESIKDHRPRIFNRPYDRYSTSLSILGETIYLFGGLVYARENWDTENRINGTLANMSDLWSLDLSKTVHTSMVPEGMNIARPEITLSREKLESCFFFAQRQFDSGTYTRRV